MREGVSARIRAWLATQDGPRTSRQMADGIGADVEFGALRRELAERRKPHRAGPGIQVIAKREAPIRADRVQTVDEWLAAGGQIQRLAQHEMSPGWRARW